MERNAFSRRIGHGTFQLCWGLTWPFWPFNLFFSSHFYDGRPDMLKSSAKEWDLLHSQRRYLQAPFCYLGPPSHILWNIKWPWLSSVLIAIAIGILSNTTRKLNIPLLLTSFHITSFAMSLLLAFKLNRAYDRWKAARRAFGRCGTRSTFLFTQAVAYIKDPKLLRAYRRFLSVYTFAVMQTALAEPELDPKAAAMLLPRELALYKKSSKGIQVIITKLHLLSSAAQLSTARMLAMEATVAELWLNAMICANIRSQALPYGLSLISLGFVQIWCTLLPLGLNSDTYGVQEFIRVPATALITLVLLSVDEVATQLEQPFPMLPLAFLANSSMTDIARVEQEAAELRDYTAAEEAIISADKAAEIRDSIATEGAIISAAKSRIL
eukprot:gene16392-22594_t